MTPPNREDSAPSTPSLESSLTSPRSSGEKIPDSYFGLVFDYVALGHYHKFSKVQERVFYAGSTERISFNEIGQDKGFVEITLEKSPNQYTLQHKFHSVPARQMIDLP